MYLFLWGKVKICKSRLFFNTALCKVRKSVQMTPVNLIGRVQEKNNIINELSDYHFAMFH